MHELLVSAKETSHVITMSQDDRCITRQQTRNLQLLAKTENEQVSIMIEKGASQVEIAFDNFAQTSSLLSSCWHANYSHRHQQMMSRL